jgi:hypothetical protein
MIFQIKAAFSCLRDSYEPFGFRVDLEFNAIDPAVNQTLRSWNPKRSGLDHEHKQPLNKSQPGQPGAHRGKVSGCLPTKTTDKDTKNVFEN